MGNAQFSLFIRILLHIFKDVINKKLERLLHQKGSCGMFHCPFCLSAIKKKEKLEEHVDCCRENEPTKVTFP